MTQFIEPNKKSDLTAPRVLDWLQSLRTGLLSGFTVTAGTSGFLLNIASGRVVIKGTSIHDDETRLDQSLGLGFDAVNRHVSLYVSYTYADTFPPAAMTIGAVVTTAATPAPPTLPADSVKIADIFIPGGAVDLSTATIINAPPLPARGNADGDVLLERLIASNANIAVTGGGGVTLSGAGPYTLTWTADIDIVAPPITHREKFGTAALVHASIAAGSLASITSNALLFTSVDRRSPNAYASPQVATLQFIDLDAPTPAQMSAFAPASERDKVIILGRVTGGVLAMTGALGALPVPTTEPPPRFLGMDPGGAHSWEAVDDTDLVGGLQTVADAAARDLIPSAQRREGMVVYSQADDRHFVLEGGVTNGDWKELGDDRRLVGGMRVITSLVAGAIPVEKQKLGALVYNLATSTLGQITAIADPPTLGPVTVDQLAAVSTVISPNILATVIQKNGAAGVMAIGNDANTTSLALGRSGQSNQLVGDLWYVFNELQAAGKISADGGVGRGSGGALSVGNDANVTDINIGTSGNTGGVNIGKLGNNTVLEGTQVNIGPASATQVNIGRSTGQSLSVLNQRMNRPASYFEDHATGVNAFATRRTISGLALDAGNETDFFIAGWPSPQEGGYGFKFSLTGQNNNGNVWHIEGTAFFNAEGDTNGLADITLNIAKRITAGTPGTISTPAGNDRVIVYLKKKSSFGDVVAFGLQALSTSGMQNSIWSGVVDVGQVRLP
jgi:hypothetical protein